jgi:hypothetical protein
MKNLFFILMLFTLTACGGGGNSANDTTPPPLLSLDGIYRGSPAIVSAGGFTYDYEILPGQPNEMFGNAGRVYTTTVNPDDTIDGTATIYENGTINTAALTGTITAIGALNLTFNNGSVRNAINVQRLAEPMTQLTGRAWCTIGFDNVTVHACSEFDVLNNITLTTPTHGPGARGDGNLLNISLVTQIEPNVYEVRMQWSICGTSTGVMGFAISEDGLHDEMMLVVVGPCDFLFWVVRATR